MIRKVHFKNFRCLKDVTLELGPLTALVGPNASGKSSVLAALDRSDPPDDGLHNLWMKDPNSTGYIEVLGQSGSARSVWNLHAGGVAQWSGPRYESQMLRLDAAALRAPIGLASSPRLDPSGKNLANAFYNLPRSKRDEIARSFCRLVPMFKDVDTRGLDQGGHRLVFQDRWNVGVWYEPEEVSDGCLMMLAFLLLPHHESRIDLLCIEEPERGLHPYLMEHLIRLLRGLGQGSIGSRTIQVLMATQSPELLNYLEATEVRLCSRQVEDGSVKIGKIDPESENWKQAYREYDESLGNLWLSGSLGGVPGI